MADYELLGARDMEDVAGARDTVTTLLSFRDYDTALLLHGTVHVNTQSRKPSLLLVLICQPLPKLTMWDTENCFKMEQF